MQKETRRARDGMKVKERTFVSPRLLEEVLMRVPFE